MPIKGKILAFIEFELHNQTRLKTPIYVSIIFVNYCFKRLDYFGNSNVIMI